MAADDSSPLAGRPLPIVEPHTREYWEGARAGRLVIQRCRDCRAWVHPPRFTCPRCQSEALAGEDASGLGTVYSYSVMRVSGGPGFDSGDPYTVAIVELEEQSGLRTVGNLVECEPEHVYCGMPVSVTFEQINHDIVLPQWRPRR